ncbi:acetate--CoA ligase [Candidatus Woesearchaeota archaeon]|nr:acetate--CoA ligase [Candidatus Woesearchaeota archaeon]
MADYIDSILKENRVFYPSHEFSRGSHIKNMQSYAKLYKKSIENPEAFWAGKANELEWFKKWDVVFRNDMGFFKWFEGGYLNVSYNCLDRIIKSGKKDKLAFIWESESGEIKNYTYKQLLQEVCRLANVLKGRGISKGHIVEIYLPMIPELPIAMLACARIGAIHSVVFAGFSSDALKDRIQDSNAEILITADGSFRNGKIFPLKENADAALQECPSIRNVIVVKRAENKINMVNDRDYWWHELINDKNILDECAPEFLHAEESLFILYTSGCCHANSLIQLSNGEIVKIKDINDNNLKTSIINLDPNHFVQTEDSITHHHKYPSNSLLIKVRTPSFEGIFTPNHRLFSLDEYGNIVEKEAGSLNKEDKVFVVSKINIKGEMQKLPDINQEKTYRNITTYRPKNIPKINNFLTANFAQIIGYFLGDGHLDKRSIIFTDKDKNNLMFYRDLIKNELQLTGNIRKIERQRLLVNSSILANYIKYNFSEIIRKSRSRGVPKIIQRSENVCIAGFLRGIFDAEGTIGRSFVKLSNTSEELIRIVQLLLRRFGIVSNVYHGKSRERQIRNRKIKETNYFDLIISQRESLHVFYNEIHFSDINKGVRLKNLMDKLLSRKIIPKERFTIFSLLKEVTKVIKVDWKGEFNKIIKFVYYNETDKNGLIAIRTFLDAKINSAEGDTSRKLELIRNKIQALIGIKGMVLEKILEINEIGNDSDFVYDLTAGKNHNYVVNGFITHNTTGKPKGILHTQAGYLLYANQTFKYIFDIKDKDIYFCTADIGWITGHSYIVYGPLSNGATVVMYEGSPTYPKPDRFWRIIEKHKATIFYTAPTAIRALAKEGDDWPNKCDLSPLRLLGTVGEPINPEAWMWYHNVIGKKKCPIVDTWWQTETGGILISPLPGATPLKPGSATLPFFGIAAEVLREDGTKANSNEGGYLVIKNPWPGMLRTIWNNPDMYKKTYFEKFGVYLTGDSAKIDEDGYFWVMGRIDDVIKVAGHRIGSAEVESSLVSHEAVAEAAVVPYPHEVKGQAIYAFVVLKKGISKDEALKEELRKYVAQHIGPIAKPDKIQFADELPKTRSGKIMRRILKAIAEGKTDYGNITTLADPGVVEIIAKTRVN